MPEIGEVARIVSRLRQHLVGKKILKVHAVEDAIVFKDTTHQEFMVKMTGKKVVAAQQWGKYFWLVMDSPPHPVMHFGMTGWMHIKNDPKAHYRSDVVETEWPPKFLKFSLTLEGDDNEVAFVDKRRLGRIRLVDANAEDIRTTEPIASNGPDPAQEKIDKSWLFSILRRKKLPVKAFLLDQSILSGLGNWVADEVLFNARIHPETYTNTLSEDQMAALFKSINYVTKVAVETEGEQEKFPKDWLMLYRWDKGKKNGATLPNGQKIEFAKVGGRTSAFVPELQLEGVNDSREEIGGIKAKSAKRGSRKKNVKEDEDEDEDEEQGLVEEEVPKNKQKKQVARGNGKRKMNKVEAEEEEGDKEEAHVDEEVPNGKSKKQMARGKGRTKRKEEEEEEEKERKPPVPKKRKVKANTYSDKEEGSLAAGPAVKEVGTRRSARLRQ